MLDFIYELNTISIYFGFQKALLYFAFTNLLIVFTRLQLATLVFWFCPCYSLCSCRIFFISERPT